MANPFDPVEFPNCFVGHNYAEDVVSGRILSCKYVIGACKRYLKEISDENHPTYFFSPHKAEKYLRVVQKFDHAIGKWSTKNILVS